MHQPLTNKVRINVDHHVVVEGKTIEEHSESLDVFVNKKVLFTSK